MTASIADLTYPAASLQFVSVPVAQNLGGSNPTGLTVAMAFPKPGTEPTTFYTASWETSGGTYYAQCLIGPGGTAQLAQGYYDVYVKVTSSPETPVIYSGLLEIT